MKNTLAQLVAQRRSHLAMTMRDVAGKADVSVSVVHGIESGNVIDCRISTLIGMAKALKLKPGVLCEAALHAMQVQEAQETQEQQPVGDQ